MPSLKTIRLNNCFIAGYCWLCLSLVVEWERRWLCPVQGIFNGADLSFLFLLLCMGRVERKTGVRVIAVKKKGTRIQSLRRCVKLFALPPVGNPWSCRLQGAFGNSYRRYRKVIQCPICGRRSPKYSLSLKKNPLKNCGSFCSPGKLLKV